MCPYQFKKIWQGVAGAASKLSNCRRSPAMYVAAICVYMSPTYDVIAVMTSLWYYNIAGKPVGASS